MASAARGSSSTLPSTQRPAKPSATPYAGPFPRLVAKVQGDCRHVLAALVATHGEVKRGSGGSVPAVKQEEEGAAGAQQDVPANTCPPCGCDTSEFAVLDSLVRCT